MNIQKSKGSEMDSKQYLLLTLTNNIKNPYHLTTVMYRMFLLSAVHFSVVSGSALVWDFLVQYVLLCCVFENCLEDECG